MAGDVLEKNEVWANLRDNAGDVWPEVAGIVVASAIPCKAERLAGVAGRDEIHDATPASAVEGGKVVPDRRRSHGAVLHARHQCRGGVGFPLHETDGAASVVGGEPDSQLKPANPGT